MEAQPDPARVLLINKPLNWTSFDVVKKIRWHFKLRKVGHAGTLDPLATGLLIVCTGKKTKEIQSFVDDTKEYTGTFTLGFTTPSYDLETEPEKSGNIESITQVDVNKVRDQFLGSIEQVPPAHSAVKVDGKRAYKSARKGEDVKLQPRKVDIFLFEVSYEAPMVHFKVKCSKGTYIRSLANDFGIALGTGAYLSKLCRTAIGDNRLEDAVEIEDLIGNESL